MSNFNPSLKMCKVFDAVMPASSRVLAVLTRASGMCDGSRLSLRCITNITVTSIGFTG